jgi:RHS repeat-associated protein
MKAVPKGPIAAAPLPIYGTGKVSLSATADFYSATEVRWYDASVGGTLLGTGTSYTTPNISATTSFYVCTYTSATGCESLRQKVDARVLPYITPSTATTEIIRVSGITQDKQIYTLGDNQKNTTTLFYDGLMRVNQTVAVRASPLGKDVVQPIEYDQFGRTKKDYLPYVASTTTGVFQSNYQAAQLSFYNNTTDKVADDSAPYALATYEDSPLGRVLEQGGVGTAWQPGANHTKTFGYSYNVASSGSQSEDVRQFNTDGTSSGYYAANMLTRSQVKDENGNIGIVYKDALGRTVARKQQLDQTINGSMVNYLTTYYVYDDMGRMKYMIPPGGVNLLSSNSWNLSAILADHVHQFVYDKRGRLTQKKTPGQDWIYYVYDKMNRLIFTQDANTRGQNKWAFVKYDGKGRAIMAGLYTNTTQTTLAAVQTLVDGWYGTGATYFETLGTTLHGYTNQCMPTTNADATSTPLEVWSVNYFDNYDFDFNGSADYKYDSTQAPGTTSQWLPYGYATGGKKLILGTSNWLYSCTYYDQLGRTIQTRYNNHLSLTVDNLTTVVYDAVEFAKVTKTTSYHNAGGTNQVTTVQTPVYDAKGRVLQMKHNTNNAGDVTVAQYEYNELGQVTDKKLHVSGSSFLQSVDYRYNIKGWLKSINNAQLVSDASVTNDETTDYFGMEMLYHTTEAGLNDQVNDKVHYNGNVSAIKWKGAGGGSGSVGQRSYKFLYDNSDKLLTATFQKYGTSAWDQETNTLNEAITYDHNGNISTLQRKKNQRGLSGTTVTSTAQLIDDLAYTYATANQLSKVEDAQGTEGFSNGSNTTTEYTYDNHGNLTADLNKGISAISYNALGKPAQMTVTTGGVTKIISYTYDAGGNKLTMSTNVGGTITTTDYVNGFVYTNGALSFFGSPEGRVVKNGSNFEYQYAIADHQGNTRILFTSAAPQVETRTATYEGSDDVGYYKTYPGTTSFGTVNNHTASGSHSQILYAGMVGIGHSYHVYAGDKVQIDAWGMYRNLSGTNNSDLTGFAATLLTAFQLSAPAPGETGTPASGLNTFGALEAGGWGDGSTDNTDVRAFVNIIIFDKNYKFLDAAYAQLTATTAGAFVAMTQNYIAKEEGYAYLYISNENQKTVDVYFDDVTMTYTPSNIIQSNEYYPFGMQTAQSWTRGSNSNNFLYDAGSELNSTSGFYDLPFRNYDAALGRFFQVDAMATTSHTLTPYHYAGNNPIGSNDPTGLYKQDWTNAFQEVSGNGGQMRDSYYDSWFSDKIEMWNDPFEAYLERHPERQMENDASKVRNGSMRPEDYAKKWGQGASNLLQAYTALEIRWWLVYTGDAANKSMALFFNKSFQNLYKEDEWYAAYESGEGAEDFQGDGHVQDYRDLADKLIKEFGSQLITNRPFSVSIDYGGTNDCRCTFSDQPGQTYGESGSHIRTYVSSLYLSETNKILLTAGHELVHVRDYDSGYYAYLLNKGTLSTDNIKAIMETRAHNWSVNNAYRLGEVNWRSNSLTKLEQLSWNLPENYPR